VGPHGRFPEAQSPTRLLSAEAWRPCKTRFDPLISSFSITYFMGNGWHQLSTRAADAFVSMLRWGKLADCKKRQGVLHSVSVVGNPACWASFLALDYLLFYVFWEVMLLRVIFSSASGVGPRREYAAISFFSTRC